MHDRTYFAADTAENLAGKLQHKLENWTNYIGQHGIKERWIKSYNLYFGRHYKGAYLGQDSSILRGGKTGELALVPVNHYRNFIRHIHVMATNQKPAFDVRATNSDVKSTQQAKLANNILEGYLHEKRLGRYLRIAAEHALVFGKGFVLLEWAKNMGKPYTSQTVEGPDGPYQQLVYEGDIEVSVPTAFDVYQDPTQEDYGKKQWTLIRKFKNKYDAATEHPDLADKILELETKNELNGKKWLTLGFLDESADVPEYTFYHKRTPSMPNGRMMVFFNKDIVIYDGPIPYEEIPLFRIVPGEIFGTVEGYSDAFDLMSLQEVFNTLYSTAFTNQQSQGLQKIYVSENTAISTEMIAQGLVVLKGPPGQEPKAINLTATAAEIFQMMQMSEKLMESLSGVNSVARGDPQSSLKSGTALALVQSMAVQYASAYQTSWAELLEDCGTFILKLLKDFAKTERIVAMVGKYNKGQIENFTGKDLDRVDKVFVELGNPLSRTTAGRIQIADNLLQNGLITTPQEYLTVMNSGTLEPLTEGPEAVLALIRRENEQMLSGKPVMAIVGDKHLLHTQEHLALLSNPLVRNEAPMVQLVTMHIMQHKQLAESQDPFWSQIAGEPPVQPPMPPMPPGPPEGAPGPSGPMPPPPGGDQGPMPQPAQPAQVPQPPMG